MRAQSRHVPASLVGLACALLLSGPALDSSAAADERVPDGAPSRASSFTPANTAAIVDSTRIDHDRQPIAKPPGWEPSYWGQRLHQGLIEPLSQVFDAPNKLLWAARAFGARTRREAVNVNSFDEAPNSAWFTNRNHIRALSVAELRQGPDSVFSPAKPWTIKHAKLGGWSAGFQIKDAAGKKWLVKLDPRGYPQLSSGADMVARTLLHGAGYNVPHNEPVRFQRRDVTIDDDLLRGTDGERFTEADLESLLTQGATFSDGSYSATASLFIAGHALGSPSMSRLRPGDSNDRYSHANRRELRGLFVLCSWVNNWDTEDHQFLDMFVETRDSLGHVEHYILDSGSSLGASALGPKLLWQGHENGVDLAWIARRLVTLGFVTEPWRRGRQETGIPSVGHFESGAYKPQHFKQLVPQPAFREMTDRDAYWGAKIVASFSNAQIAAAVEAAHYEDSRASDYLVRNLIVRRDKIARHWFGRVAPLDFFWVQDGTLRFHDLAVDVGLVGPRGYDIEVESTDGRTPETTILNLSGTALPLLTLGDGASRLSLEISVAGSGARPAYVELKRKNSVWTVTRVRHG